MVKKHRHHLKIAIFLPWGTWGLGHNIPTYYVEAAPKKIPGSTCSTFSAIFGSAPGRENRALKFKQKLTIYIYISLTIQIFNKQRLYGIYMGYNVGYMGYMGFMWDIYDPGPRFASPPCSGMVPPLVRFPPWYGPPYHTTGGERGLYQGIMPMDDDHTT